MIDHGKFVVPATTRSRLMLEVASELVGGKDSGATAGHDKPPTSGTGKLATDLLCQRRPRRDRRRGVRKGPGRNYEPGDPLALAYRGTGPYTKPLPLSVVTVIPSEDQMAFAVSERAALPLRRNPQAASPAARVA